MLESVRDAVTVAREWIKTDPSGCRDDLKRLGLSEAATYQIGMICAAVDAGDRRWAAIASHDARAQEAVEIALSDLYETDR